ncbi:flavodoxin family protein [Companilactobacillus huachuanensis]|uniref:Flavodoxin family protein n=1 Tax=Companilactobacillus huachuanensis TaxID=2559914 RepID=A0ABW1RPA6_9LACO|nr:flavodoxin [Companilactobacillus huachuanensis]
MNDKFQKATIDGQKITAYQLGKSSIEWRNGAGTTSDGKDTNSSNQPTRKITDAAESIIIYFSRSGSTELLASKIEKETNADVLEITVKDSYPSNYPKTLDRANYERDNQDYPELNMELPNLEQYKTVYLGYPIWAMTLSHPMHSFLNAYGSQLSNKRIAPFMSEGGYGQGDSVQVVKEILRQQGAVNNTFTSALVVDGNKVDRADKQVNDWINR